MPRILDQDKVEEAYFVRGSDLPDCSGHGDCLHHVLECYIRTLRTNPKLRREDAFKAAHKALHVYFERENRQGRLRLLKPASRPDMWTVGETKAWVLRCLRRLILWFKEKQIVWIQEEMSLQFEVTFSDGTRRLFNLGKPDLVGYSAKTGRYITMDYKTSQKSLESSLSNRIAHQLLKHALGLHLYFKKQNPPQTLLEIETAALFFMVSRGPLEFKARSQQVVHPFELFRRKGKSWKRRQERYKPLVKNFSTARYMPAKR